MPAGEKVFMCRRRKRTNEQVNGGSAKHNKIDAYDTGNYF